jgi:hypothetical protein
VQNVSLFSGNISLDFTAQMEKFVLGFVVGTSAKAFPF